MLKYCPDCQQKYPEDTEFCAQDGTRLRVLDESRDDPIIGRVLDERWVIEERIGEGGMGAVYLASQRSIDRKVAIKTLKPSLSNNREFVDRFFREARVASTINHPHCVMIHDFGQTDDGLLYLAMEYLEGLPLTDRLKHKDMSLKEIIEVSIQISSALAAAHSHNIIHRDLKPDNIFMLSIQDGSTFIKVLDFGIAKVLDSEEKMTKTGQVFGTPEYMSPEQCRGDDIDGRSDLYSMGCILYEMLGGRPPFESKTPMAVLVSHVRETPAHILESSDREIPQSLAELCMKLLSKQASERYVDAQQVRKALEQELTKLSGSGPSTPVQSSQPNTNTAPASGSSTPIPTPAEQVELGKANTAASPAAPGDSRPIAGSQTTGSVNSPQPRESGRGPLIAILVVLFVLVSIAGCVAGVYFVEPFGLFADDEGAIAESETPTDDNSEGSSDQAGDDDSSPGAIAQRDDKLNQDERPGDVPEGSETDNNPSDDGDENSGDSDGQPPNGDEGQDGATGSGSSTGGSGSGDTTGNQNVGNQNVGNQNVGNQNVGTQIVETEIVDTKIESGGSGGDSDSSDDSDDESNSGSDDNNVSATSGGSDEPEEPSGPSGNARRTKLSATGAACMKPDIQSKLSGAERGFESCYDKQLSSNPSLNGNIILAWNIDTSGEVLAPKALVDRVGNPALSSCILGKLKSVRFSPPSGGRCYVRATYSFSK